MTVPMRSMTVEDDAGALVLRYQQRIRAELLKKAAQESTWSPRWRRGAISSTQAPGDGAIPLAERMLSVLHALDDQRHFDTSGLVLALVSAAASAALLLSSSALIGSIGLMALGAIVVLGITRPARRAALGLAAISALAVGALALVDGPAALLPGLVAVLGLIGSGYVAERYGIACHRGKEEREQTRRLIDDMQPVHEDAGVLKWPHASLVFDRELARAHRYGHPLTLLRVVVSQWDAVREELGPEQAAQVLKEVGTLLVKSSRVVDVVAYHDDGKFDLLLPDTADLGAVVVARRVGTHNVAHPGVRLRVGVAPVVGREGGIDDLIQQGDDAAVTAERLGRPFAIYGVEARPADALKDAQRAALNVRR